MKRNILFQNEQLLLLLVAICCVCSEAYKLPYDLRPSRLPKETQMQLHSEEHQTSPDAPRKPLRFPETDGDGNENEDYSVQISFRNSDDPSGSDNKADATDNLRRFYKYFHEQRERSKEAIVFPNENLDNVKDHKIHISNEESIDGMPVISRSEGDNDNVSHKGQFTKESQLNAINATYFQQSIQTFAQMVRQLLFRAPPPPEIEQRSEDVFQSENSESSTTSSELDVLEQSLYSGPRVRVQGAPSECPQGTKKTRKGSCQKPSRRLIT